MIAVLYAASENTKFDMRARVLNRELLEWHLAALKTLEIKQAVIVGDTSDEPPADLRELVDRARDYWNVQVQFAHDAPDLPAAEHVLLLQRTHIYAGDLSALRTAHFENRNTLTIGARDIDRGSPQGYASVVGRVSPPMILAPALDWRRLGRADWNADALQDLVRELENSKTQLVHVDAYWHPLHHGLDLYHANQEMLEELASSGRVALRECEIAPGIFAGCDTRIHPRAQLQGPVLIGERCFIGPGARVEAGAIIENDAYICGGATVRRALIGSGAYVRSGTTIEGAILLDSSPGRVGLVGMASTPANPISVSLGLPGDR